jgi:hypothetical protein
MVETAVVMSTLTQEMIDQGAALVRALEQDGVTVLAAFWFLNIETGRWRLFGRISRRVRASISVTWG